jgi:hypothetical protein
MNFAAALFIYFVFFILFLWGFTKYGMGIFSSLALTVLLSGLVLLILLPPSEIDRQIDRYFKNKPHHKANNWVVIAYLFIYLFSLIVLSIYIVMKAWEDKSRRTGNTIPFVADCLNCAI